MAGHGPLRRKYPVALFVMIWNSDNLPFCLRRSGAATIDGLDFDGNYRFASHIKHNGRQRRRKESIHIGSIVRLHYDNAIVFYRHGPLRRKYPVALFVMIWNSAIHRLFTSFGSRDD